MTLKVTLKSTEGESTNLVLPEITFDKSSCGRCYVKMPILEITSTTFVTKIRGINIKFNLPNNFFLNTIALVNEENNKFQRDKVWVIPNKMTPKSISADAEIVYFELPNKKYEGIVLAFFRGGLFQFFDKKDLDVSLKGTPYKVENTEISFLSFGKGKDKKLLGFNKPSR